MAPSLTPKTTSPSPAAMVADREQDLAPLPLASPSTTMPAQVVCRAGATRRPSPRNAKGLDFKASVFRKRAILFRGRLSKAAQCLYVSKSARKQSTPKRSVKRHGRLFKANAAASQIISAVDAPALLQAILFPLRDLPAELRMNTLTFIFKDEQPGVLKYVKTSSGPWVLTISGNPTPVVTYRTLLHFKGYHEGGFFEEKEVEDRFWALVTHSEGDWADVVRLYKPAASSSLVTTLPARKIEKVVILDYAVSMTNAREAIALLEASPALKMLTFAGNSNNEWNGRGDWFAKGLSWYVGALVERIGLYLQGLRNSGRLGFEADYDGVYTNQSAQDLDALKIAWRCKKLAEDFPGLFDVYNRAMLEGHTPRRARLWVVAHVAHPTSRCLY
ncbi:hypothetical protein BU16DRAFT_532459 [Lophium mytilinum]|uniref:Uncharacterized protein n=1 Tax=Lophium mytilinum TaxID=390894 RepID=A0A6A6RF04_9PEZI|nr:hypothetical protein BU16DRAFT_532459 [Lophium mytilinum]